MKYFILLSTVAMITDIVSLETIAKEMNFFNTIMQLINPNYSWKNGVKLRKINQEKLSQKWHLLSHL